MPNQIDINYKSQNTACLQNPDDTLRLRGGAGPGEGGEDDGDGGDKAPEEEHLRRSSRAAKPSTKQQVGARATTGYTFRKNSWNATGQRRLGIDDFSGRCAGGRRGGSRTES